MTAGTPEPPPEAVLIRRAREAAGIRTREAARRARISVARWSQVENGRETRDGAVRPVRAPAGTIAHMANAVGLTPERLSSEGQRRDAAEILREIRQLEAAQQHPGSRETAGPEAAEPPVKGLSVYLMWVRADVERAVRDKGPEFSGRDAFTKPHEIVVWDTPEQADEVKIRTIARMRREIALSTGDVDADGSAGLSDE